MKLLVSFPKKEDVEIEVESLDVKVSDVKEIISKKTNIPQRNIHILNSTKRIAKNNQTLKQQNITDRISAIIIEKKEEETMSPSRIFNSFIKAIKDKSGGDETQTEILFLIEKAKVKDLIDILSQDPKLFRDLIEQNPILQENLDFECCLVETFEMLGVSCDEKPTPISDELVCDALGITNKEEVLKRLETENKLRKSFNGVKEALKICGGVEVITKPGEKTPRPNLQKIFARQIQYLQSMGYYDMKLIMKALANSGGDLNGAALYISDKTRNI